MRKIGTCVFLGSTFSYVFCALCVRPPPPGENNMRERSICVFSCWGIKYSLAAHETGTFNHS